MTSERSVPWQPSDEATYGTRRPQFCIKVKKSFLSEAKGIFVDWCGVGGWGWCGGGVGDGVCVVVGGDFDLQGHI